MTRRFFLPQVYLRARADRLAGRFFRSRRFLVCIFAVRVDARREVRLDCQALAVRLYFAREVERDDDLERDDDFVLDLGFINGCPKLQRISGANSNLVGYAPDRHRDKTCFARVSSQV